MQAEEALVLLASSRFEIRSATQRLPYSPRLIDPASGLSHSSRSSLVTGDDYTVGLDD
jgi:hypothetical protein